MRIPIVHFNDTEDGEPAPAIRRRPCEPVVDLVLPRRAQAAWAATPVKERLRLARKLRALLAETSLSITRGLGRSATEDAEILAAQILPLADACRFLEKETVKLLRPRELGSRLQPFWLRGTGVQIRREPCGVVLVIAPSNYPLLLPGVVVLQALLAGNAVLLKPGPGGMGAAAMLSDILVSAGLPDGLLTLLPPEEGSVQAALDAGVDKVVFTGGARTGRTLLHEFAEHLVPAVMELSGSDAMFVRHDADVPLAAEALLFGLRLNQGATCIAPRRVFVHRSRAAELERRIVELVTRRGHRRLGSSKSSSHITHLVIAATASGARVLAGEVNQQTGGISAPVIVTNATPSMRLLREDHFGPAAAIVAVRDDEEALRCNDECPYALGATIFSASETEARALAARINAGVVVINDIIVPTADPRVPFGGRKASGFGVTRGAEGLLELTVPKVVMTRRNRWRPHLEPPADVDREIFTQYLKVAHSEGWGARCKAAGALIRAIYKRKTNERTN